MQLRRYKQYKQHDERDCGAACLATILSYYGRQISLTNCRELVKTDIQGTNLYGIVDGARQQGLDADAYEGEFYDLVRGVQNKEFVLPIVVHVITEDNMEHFVVVTSITGKYVKGFDPAKGKFQYKNDVFIQKWTGHMVAFSPTDAFQEGKFSKGIISSFAELVQGNVLFFINATIVSCLIVVISLLGAFAYQQVVDALSNGIWIESKESLEFIMYGMFALAGMYIFQMLLQMGRNTMICNMSKKLGRNMMNQYAEKLFQLPMSYFHNLRSGELLSRFTDMADIRDAITQLSLILIFNCFTLLGGVAVMAVINPVLLGLVVIITIIYLGLFVIFKPVISKLNYQVMSKNAKTVSDIKELTDGIETVKLYHGKRLLEERLTNDFEELTQKEYSSNMVHSLQNTIVYFVESMGVVLTLGFGAWMVIKGEMSLGMLVTFSTLISYVVMPVREAIELQPAIQRSIVAMERLNDILEAKSEKQVKRMDESVDLNGAIRLEHIVFRYANHFPTLQNLSLVIRKGEKIAITGSSGCGKTTLAKLLLKINIPEEGSIVINGLDINEISEEDLRNKIIYVPQDMYFFSDTVWNNLTMGNSEIQKEEVIKICEQCMIYNLIQSMPSGFDTLIEENGKNLSGGQRQRLAIARALLRKPEILILDEATSHLDSITEKGIQNAIFNYSDGITCIIIAHRLQTIQKCERVAYMENGTISEIGMHDELIAKRGSYYQMWSAYINEDGR